MEGFDHRSRRAIELGYSGPVRIQRIKELLAESKIYEDAATVVYDPAKLRPPGRPETVLTEDWPPRTEWHDTWNCLLPRKARIKVYNPDPDMDMVMIFDAASAHPGSESVRLLAGDRELASWDVEPDHYQRYYSKPFHMSAGFHELIVESTTKGLNACGSLRPSLVATASATGLHPCQPRERASGDVV